MRQFGGVPVSKVKLDLSLRQQEIQLGGPFTMTAWDTSER